MQFNIYVPQSKSHIIESLENAAKAARRPKNEIVLEALERYLPDVTVELGRFNMGVVNVPKRSELYESRTEV
jgi:hypothetical protein